MKTYLEFWKGMIYQVLNGSRLYYAWVGSLLAVVLLGAFGYRQQFESGLIVTRMSDQVSWGAYIANFTYIVGLAAAAVMLTIPAYLYRRGEFKKITIIGELFAIAAIVMCLLFVTVDMGRPDRFWHIFPFIGRMNWPISMLSWDVIVLTGYLLLNLHIPGYLLYKKYLGEEPTRRYYLPFIFISIFWAISIHTVTAFLYSGLGGRPFWNSAILAPRFLASAFAVGPCFLLLAIGLIQRFTRYAVPDEAVRLLRNITAVTLVINLFLFGCEVFKEFYTDSSHSSSAKYLLIGLRGSHMLVPYIWTALLFNVAATLAFTNRKLNRQPVYIHTASVLAILGIWIEKGMGLIIPGFVPTPLGDIVEYTPSLVEIEVCAGIWAFGLLLFTLMLKAVIPIETGDLRVKRDTIEFPVRQPFGKI